MTSMRCLIRSAPPPTPARSSPGSTSCPGVTAPGASTSTNGTRPPARFLSRSTSSSTSSTEAPLKVRGSAARGEQLLDLGAQWLAARQAQRDEQADGDGLAVPVARVAGGRLDGVPDGVAEVQHLPAAGVALVLGDHRELRPQAAEDHVGVRVAALPHPRPQRSTGDQRRLHDLGVAGRELLGRQRLERGGIADHGRGLVEDARVVLALGQVDARLALRRPSPPAPRARSAPARGGCRAGRSRRRSRQGRPPRRRPRRPRCRRARHRPRRGRAARTRRRGSTCAPRRA